MSAIQMINIIVLMRCCIILPLKVSAQTYASYGFYQAKDASLEPYNQPSLYGSLQEFAPNVEIMSWLMPISPFQYEYMLPAETDLQKAIMETVKQQNQQGDQSKMGLETFEQGINYEMNTNKASNVPNQQIQATNQLDDQESKGSIFIPHKPIYTDEEGTDPKFFANSPTDQESEESIIKIPYKLVYTYEEGDNPKIAANLSDDQESEGSIFIPHKSVYIDEEEDQKLSSSGTPILTSSEIAGTVLGGLMFLLLFIGVAGAVYLYFVQRGSQNIQQVLSF